MFAEGTGGLLMAENPHNLNRPIGAALSRDIATGEKVEAELGSFISRRHDERVRSEGSFAGGEEALWAESERRHQAKRKHLVRLEWHAFHCGQAERHRRTLESLISFHEAEAARYLPKGAA
jgi:hypothetical protein